MSKNNLDTVIKTNLAQSTSAEEIEVQKDTMARIEAYEIKREKIKYFFCWILSLFSFIVCLGSLASFESLFNRVRLYLVLIHINPLTMKWIFQGVFAFILAGLFFLMFYTLNSKNELFHIPET